MAAPEVNKYVEMRALALSQQASLADAASFYPSFSQKVRGHAKRKRSEEGSLSEQRVVQYMEPNSCIQLCTV